MIGVQLGLQVGSGYRLVPWFSAPSASEPQASPLPVPLALARPGDEKLFAPNCLLIGGRRKREKQSQAMGRESGGRGGKVGFQESSKLETHGVVGIYLRVK